jgi:hypothetical protein
MIALAIFGLTGCALTELQPGRHKPSPTRVPKRAASNPELESQMLEFLNHRNRPETYEVVILRSPDWATLRHEVSGVVVGRVQSVDAGARWADGHCTFQGFEIAQDFDGQRYTERLLMRGIGEQWEITCDTLEVAKKQAAAGASAPPPGT